MLRRVYAMTMNTFREAVRDRVLFGIVGFSGAFLLFTLALAELSLNQGEKVIEDVGMACISLSAVLMSIVLGSSLLYKEIERKTLYVVLPKPISRSEFLVGKYLGIVLSVFVFEMLIGAVHLLDRAIYSHVSVGWLVAVPSLWTLLMAIMWAQAKDRTMSLVPGAFLLLVAMCLLARHGHIDLKPTLAALVLVFLEVCVVTAITMVFSSFSTPFLTGVLTLGLWILGRSTGAMVTLKTAGIDETTKMILRFFGTILPNLQLFVPGSHVLLRLDSVYGGVTFYLLQALGYSVLYSVLLLILATTIFAKRDFL